MGIGGLKFVAVEEHRHRKYANGRDCYWDASLWHRCDLGRYSGLGSSAKLPAVSVFEIRDGHGLEPNARSLQWRPPEGAGRSTRLVDGRHPRGHGTVTALIGAHWCGHAIEADIPRYAEEMG